HSGEHLGEQPITTSTLLPLERVSTIHRSGPARAACGFRLPMDQPRLDKSVEVEPGGITVQPRGPRDVHDRHRLIRSPYQLQHVRTSPTVRRRGRRIGPRMLVHTPSLADNISRNPHVPRRVSCTATALTAAL